MINSNKVRAFIPDDVPDEALNQAIEDASTFLESYDVSENDPRFELMARLMVCHLLYLRGFASILLSQTVGDMSITRKDIELGDKEGSSPYLIQFRTLLRQSDFLVSV